VRQKREIQIGQDFGEEEELALTIKIPKGYAEGYKANLEKVTQAATKTVLDKKILRRCRSPTESQCPVGE